jgi:transposase
VISIPHSARCLVRIPPTDFRMGIDKLTQLVKTALLEDPFSGALFLFTNRARTAIKILYYDGQGYWLCLKRLSAGRLRGWPSSADDGQAAELSAREIQVLLWNGEPNRAGFGPDWRKIGNPPADPQKTLDPNL